MAEDDGKKPEGQEGTGSNPNVQSGSEEDAMILDELTSLQDTEDTDMGGQMQGRENAGGQGEALEDMGYMASVHRGGFSTDQDVMDGMVPPQDVNFMRNDDIVTDDEGGDGELDRLGDGDDGRGPEEGSEEPLPEEPDDELAQERRREVVEDAAEPALGDADDDAITPSVGTLDVFADVEPEEPEEEPEPEEETDEEPEEETDEDGGDTPPPPLPEDFLDDIITVPDDGPTPDDPIVIYEADIIKAIGPFDDADISAIYLNEDGYLGDGANGSDDADQVLANGVPIEVTLDEDGLRIWTIRTGFDQQDSDINVSVTVTRGDYTNTSSNDYSYDVDNTLADDTGSVAWNDTVDLDVLDNDTLIDNNLDYAQDALTFEPEEGYVGTQTIAYEVTDSDGTVTAQTIDLTIDENGVVTGPDGVEITAQDGSNAVTVDLTSLHDGASITSVTQPANGSVEIVDVKDNPSLITHIEGQEVSVGDSVDLTRQVFNEDGSPATDGDGNNVYETVATLTLNEDGTIGYDPAIREEGTFDFEYTVTDDDGETTTATVSVSVDDNGAPTAMDDAFSGTEDQPIVFTKVQLLGNDTDVDGDSLTITSFDQPANGTVVDNGNDTYTFTPNDDWNGETDFTYTISDGHGGTDTATVTIDVTGVNDGPVADDDAFSGKEDQSITFSKTELLANDSDIDGDTLTITGFDQPDHGTIVDNGDGTFTFTPDDDWNGETDFTYTISDGNGGTDTATVTLEIEGVNDGPVATDDAFSGSEDQSIYFTKAQLLVNDTDIDGDTLSVTSFDQPENGTVTDLGNGILVFTPNEDWNGETDFTYTISDGNGGSDTATVTLNIDGVNDAPDISTLNLSDGTEYAEYTLTADDLLGAVSDVDGDALSITDVSSTDPDVTITNNGDGTWTIVSSEEGEQSINFSVSDGTTTTTATTTIDFADVDNAPVDDTASTDQDSSVTLNISDLLANDNMIDGGTITGISDTEHGTVDVDLDAGTITFTPDAGFDGDGASFTYIVTDEDGETSTATVNIDVNDINNTLSNDNVTLSEDSSKTIDVIDNDTIVDGGTVTEITQPEHGVAVLHDDGTVTYTPTDDYNGSDSFTYTVTDNDGDTQIATVHLTVDPVNDAPVVDSVDLSNGTEYATYTITESDLLAHATDIDTGADLEVTGIAGGSNLTITEVTQTGDPERSWEIVSSEEGEENITFMVTDNQGATVSQTATIDFADVDNAPVDDTGSTDQDSSVTFNISELLANDNIVDGGSITGVTETQHGEVSIDFDAGTITFTPDAGYDGEDASFTYSVTDEDGEITNATVHIDVNDIDNTLSDDTATLSEDSSKVIHVLDNDTIVDGGEITSMTQPEHGTVVLNDDGTVTYTPDENYNGADSFTYTVTDNDNETQTATVNLTVDPQNDDPVALTESLEASEDGAAVTGQLDATDVDG
ncbi:MAG: tandem-95 repeat protein, partial [Methylocystaceae bacterium]|nr:tandem-95 repeat protein [Methylocystaceae bacterium]